ncbi:sigma-70 family RNA polymerase sigma factor [Streptomyces sp. 1222.5]|uniref:sigma-70 family RNA polymerase sigma factor n=1 Tax=Streptomyces sp. 1222.5 TaxID=1881026 RepID=UPI003EC09909
MITSALPASRTQNASADAAVTAWALAARSGDPQAAERFVRALHSDVLRFVTHLGADPQNVDDLTQDTFVRALDSLHRFEGRASARTWLLSIARRAVVDSFRRAAVRPRTAHTHDWQAAAEWAQPRGLPGFDDGIALLDLLETLPDERREAFVLTQVVGLSYEEAARFGGCPVGTVRSRVARARMTLAALLAEADGPAGSAAAGKPTPPGTSPAGRAA